MHWDYYCILTLRSSFELLVLSFCFLYHVWFSLICSTSPIRMENCKFNRHDVFSGTRQTWSCPLTVPQQDDGPERCVVSHIVGCRLSLTFWLSFSSQGWLRPPHFLLDQLITPPSWVFSMLPEVPLERMRTTIPSVLVLSNTQLFLSWF